MEPFIYIAIFNIIILAFAFITKKGLFTISPEEEWADNLNQFDKNIKALNDINICNYKLGSSHLYNKN